MPLSIFLPVRAGSERVLEKNTRSFAGIEGGLLQLKLEQLSSLILADEVIVSSNSKKCLQIAETFKTKIKNLKLIERPDELGSSSTPLQKLIKHAAEITNFEHILWTHVTSPFFDQFQYREAIAAYYNRDENKFDSLLSCRKYNDFLMQKKTGKILNNTTSQRWPRTQDLEDCFELNNAVFLCARKFYEKGERVGEKPYFMENSKISSIDIDDEEDFKLAEIIYEHIQK